MEKLFAELPKLKMPEQVRFILRPRGRTLDFQVLVLHSADSSGLTSLSTLFRGFL